MGECVFIKRIEIRSMCLRLADAPALCFSARRLGRVHMTEHHLVLNVHLANADISVVEIKGMHEVCR